MDDKQEMQIVAKIIREESNQIPAAHDEIKWFFTTVANILEHIAKIGETS